MATQKKPAAKTVKTTNASASGAKKAAPAKKTVAKAAPKKAAPAKNLKKSVPAKKAAPVKKAVAAKKTETAKKAAPAKKATVSKAVPAKKAAPAKKVVPVKKAAANTKPDQKKSTNLKKTENKKATAPAKAAPEKKAVAKKAAPAAKAAPAKKAVAKAAPAKKSEPAKAAPEAKAAPVKKAPAKKGSKNSSKQPTKTVTTFAKTALPNRPSASASASTTSSSRASAPTRSTVREEKKVNVVVAHRRLDNKAKDADKAGKTMINYQPDFTRSVLDEPEQLQGPVYRYSDEELNEFRELIQGRLESARKELNYLQGLITRKDEAGTEDTENRYMNMEDGSGAMEREQLAQLASRQIQFINHLEKAQIRIENKTYGICRVTGKLIDKARLRAVPHATLSIEAKKTMNSK